jgi:PPM family protein phosphatase
MSPIDDNAKRDLGTRPLPIPPDDPAPAQASPVPSAVRAGQLIAAALRDVGRVREVNQDHVFAMTATVPREGSDLLLGLFVVADGMGGHEGGEIASQKAVATAVRHILAELLAPALDGDVGVAIRPLLVAALQDANRAVWDHARMLGSDMGTTCTLALLLGRSLHVAHVGDSRAYLLGPGEMRQLTDDHSAVGRLIELGQLDPQEAREHPLRSHLFRTVGQQPEVAVDLTSTMLADATHLLLASDGLWSLVDDDTMRAVVTSAPTPQAAVEELVARANAAGGDDNISAIVVQLPSQHGGLGA